MYPTGLNLCEYPVYKIGQKVVSVRDGDKVGRIYDYVTGVSYRTSRPEKFTDWDGLYPGWQHKPVYFVMFETPKLRVSEAELKTLSEPEKAFENAEFLQLAFCEEDIRPYE